MKAGCQIGIEALHTMITIAWVAKASEAGRPSTWVLHFFAGWRARREGVHRFDAFCVDELSRP